MFWTKRKKNAELKEIVKDLNARYEGKYLVANNIGGLEHCVSEYPNGFGGLSTCSTTIEKYAYIKIVNFDSAINYWQHGVIFVNYGIPRSSTNALHNQSKDIESNDTSFLNNYRIVDEKEFNEVAKFDNCNCHLGVERDIHKGDPIDPMAIVEDIAKQRIYAYRIFKEAVRYDMLLKNDGFEFTVSSEALQEISKNMHTRACLTCETCMSDEPELRKRIENLFIEKEDEYEKTQAVNRICGLEP